MNTSFWSNSTILVGTFFIYFLVVGSHSSFSNYGEVTFTSALRYRCPAAAAAAAGRTAAASWVKTNKAGVQIEVSMEQKRGRQA